MNWLKWVICWYHSRHVYTIFQDIDGRALHRCVRCGAERDIPARVAA